MEEIIVRFLNINLIKNNLDKISFLVDENRIKKSNHYLKDIDKYLSLGAGYLMNKYLPNKEIKYNQNNKPYFLDGPFFNISHSGEIVVLVISNKNEIGIDIQKINEKDLNAIKYATNKDLSLNDMFLMWSNKESLIKCLGENMSIIKDVPGLPLSGERNYNNQCFYTKSMLKDDYSLSVTLKGNNPFIVKIDEIKEI